MNRHLFRNHGFMGLGWGFKGLVFGVSGFRVWGFMGFGFGALFSSWVLLLILERIDSLDLPSRCQLQVGNALVSFDEGVLGSRGSLKP